MPDFPFVDAHVHLWDPRTVYLPWITGNALLDQPYLLPRFDAHLAGLQLDAFVYLETGAAPHYAFYEAQWAVALAGQDPRLKGVVAAAPLEYGQNTRSYLHALRQLGPLIKGVRRITQGEPDPFYCLQPDFLAGVRLLPEFGFSCDLCINQTQLSASTELVRRCPETQFVLDHLAKPDIRNSLLDPWRSQLTALAALPNVVCKLSGVLTEAGHHGWTASSIAPFIAHALNAFGEERVLFGGDWPVVLGAASYRCWVETLDELIAPLSSVAKQKLWKHNAMRVYRLT